MLQHLPLFLKLLTAAGILIALYTFLFYSEEIYKFAGHLINFIFKTILFIVIYNYIEFFKYCYNKNIIYHKFKYLIVNYHKFIIKKMN